MKYLLTILLSFVLFTSCENRTGDDPYKTVIVHVVAQQQDINTDSEGKTTSTTVYMVYTNDGTYQVELSGPWAHPELLSKIHEGDTIGIHYLGINSSFLGAYPTITDVKENN